jgi:putative tricarboxylic transport membrane protein
MVGGGQNSKDRTTVNLAAGEPMKKSAIVTSILFLVLALGAFIESMKLPFGRVSAPAAGFFPAVLAVLLALASLFAFVEALRGSHEGAVQGESLTWRKIVLTLGALLVFGFVFERLGYLLATFLFIIFLLRAVERQSWSLAVSVALSASLVSYVVFGLLLGTPLPPGFLQL